MFKASDDKFFDGASSTGTILKARKDSQFGSSTGMKKFPESDAGSEMFKEDDDTDIMKMGSIHKKGFDQISNWNK